MAKRSVGCVIADEMPLIAEIPRSRNPRVGLTTSRFLGRLFTNCFCSEKSLTAG